MLAVFRALGLPAGLRWLRKCQLVVLQLHSVRLGKLFSLLLSKGIN